MWKTLTTIGVTLGLAGCYTMPLSELTQTKPNMQGTVSRSVDEFSNCVYESWGANLGVNRFRLDNGVRLVIPSGNGPYGAIDITEDGGHAQYRYYQYGENFGQLQGKMRSGLKACL